jgi:transcriptional regulator with XRE-family HTH domain
MKDQKSHLADNLKFLRKRGGFSQEVVAGMLDITRAQVNSYENGFVKNPPMEVLMDFSKIYTISIDNLIKVNINELTDFQVKQMEAGNDTYITGKKLRVIATTVDSDDKENIELVPIKVKAGYTAGYNDPQFISTLPVFQLPFVSKDRKYRAFQMDGDSMLPIRHGSYVIAEFVENWFDIKDGMPYIVLTREGAAFKIVYNQVKKRKKLLLKSRNPVYDPYEVNIEDVLEIWKFTWYFTNEMPEPITTTEHVFQRLADIESQLNRVNKAK